MAEVAHVFICDRVYEDDRGQPCVIGMFDHIWAPQFPLNHPHMAIAVQMLGRGTVKSTAHGRASANSAKWDRQIDPVVLRCSQH